MHNITALKNKVLKKKEISLDEALELTKTSSFFELFSAANEIREKFMANEVVLCSIVNAKSGNCNEDCSFCGQSAKYNTNSENYKMLNIEELKKSIDNAQQNNATEFSLVTSGRKIPSSKNNNNELKTIAKAIEYTKQHTNMEACSSLGLMTEEELIYLKDHGMDHYHHNLETARSHFNNIVSSHSYDEEMQAIKNAKNIGLKVCCGGIFGMGENWKQRIELAFDIKKLDVDTVPVNFLIPIKGTPLENLELIEPYQALKIVSILRFILPDKNIMVMGGRERILRDMQSWVFFAGANGLLVGNYLTTKGRSANDDIQMIKDLGFKIKDKCHN